MNNIMLLPILIPIAGAIAVFLQNRGQRPISTHTHIIHGNRALSPILKEAIVLLAVLANLFIAVKLFGKNINYSVPWAGFGLEFVLRNYHFSSFIMSAVAIFGLLVTLYSTAFLRDKGYARLFYTYLLISIALANGAVLADNLILLLFFWEGLLLTLFGMIAIGNPNAYKTATKAFIIVGVSDLCMMSGMAIAGKLAGTLTISGISLSISGLGGLAFIFLVIGAIAKAGSMPFHSWIPDAAIDAPLPFMAILPAALEKLLGIYFLARISLDMFKTSPHSWASTFLMTVGAITIIFAVMMALIQKDYKKLLSYHAISQVGYMILGIGTFVPVGIIGGLFHMINHAMYKSCLFLTGGAVEKQAGTTDLEKLGGLAYKMPVTFVCFIIAAASISGVPPFNGFFSKELVYDGALERGWIFYAAAVLGSFLTAASFLKLGHAVYFGKNRDSALFSTGPNTKIGRCPYFSEAPIAMLIPMVIIALACILFGVWNYLPLKYLIQPILGEHLLEGRNFYGFPTNPMLVIVTILVLIAAVINHLYGVKRTGSALRAAEHIHYAPVLSKIYEKAETRYYDPYEIGRKLVKLFSRLMWGIDKAIDWIYNDMAPKSAYFITDRIRRLHDGNYKTYMVWSLAGAGIILIFFIRCHHYSF
ncbi:MAG: NADH-quinone oxidoreductase subunit L [Candidatus Omnitrophica bacterium]|nr:NADH-quinone oxidoreductase subunit L [Candidatus Omnitrophota bacterium]